jgi:hypothetical protein
VSWQPTPGVTLPPQRLTAPLMVPWWSPPDAPSQWVDPLDGQPHAVTGTPETLTFAGQTWTYREGVVQHASLPGEWQIVPAEEAHQALPQAPVQVLSVPGDLPSPRTTRRLTVRAPDGRTVTIERPLAAEIGPTAGPPNLGLQIDPAVDLQVPPTPHVLQTVTAHIRAVRAHMDLVTRVAPPDATLSWAEGQGDCDDLAAILVASLTHAGVPARRVQGWIHAAPPDTRFVRHGWVEVSLPAPWGWTAVDPALNQPLSDATHLPDHAWGAAGPPRSFDVVAHR